MKKTWIIGAAIVATGALGVQAQASDAPPRGPDVDDRAANCNIGPFPQTSKAGPYNDLCDVMPDGEKCLASIKLYMNGQGEIRPVDGEDVERAAYCIEVFRQELAGLK